MRMLPALGSALLLASLARGSAEPPPPPAGDDVAPILVDLEKQSWEAWKKRDGAFFEKFLTEDHLDVHSSGPLDKKAVVAAVSSPACAVKSYSVSGFRVARLADDAARLVYRAEQGTTCSGHPVPSPSWIQSIYVRRDGRWQNAGFQVTDAAKP